MKSFHAFYCSFALLCASTVSMPCLTQAATWTGGGGDDLASNAGNWEGGEAPSSGDAVMLSASASSNMTWDLDIAVGSWTQDGYTGTVTIATHYGDANFTNLVIVGDCLLNSGTWTHYDNSSAETYRLRVSVGGDMTVGAGAKIDATGLGYDPNRGPGAPDSHGGGTHGGQATRNDYGTAKMCYGSIASPVNLGSGGWGGTGRGGGAILINVAGALTVNGIIEADGFKRKSSGEFDAYYAGAGGSVWLTANLITGSGTITASAGYIKHNYHGGGGRVALVQTGSATNFAGFTGIVEALGTKVNGTTQYGAAGTVYYETSSDGRGHGIVVIDANASASDDEAKTGIIPEDQDEGFAPKKYIIRNKANAEIIPAATYTFHPGNTLEISRDASVYVKGGTTVDLRGTEVVNSSTTAGMMRLYSGTGILMDSGATLTNITIWATDSDVASATPLTITAPSLAFLNNATLIADYPVIFIGDLTVAAGGKITHSANAYTETFKANVTVRGNMTIAEGGSVNVDGRGYRAKSGSGAVSSPNYYGACHGGRGVYYSNGANLTAASCYGSIRRPTTMGSGGITSQSGGGVIRLNVAGTLLNNGSITANGLNNGNLWSAAGGSIWLTAGTIAGKGDIMANGAAGSTVETITYEKSGGGRIAIELTDSNANFEACTGIICARGSGHLNNKIFGGAGTVYLKTSAQTDNGGTLVIDNFVTDPTCICGTTDISPLVTDTDVGSVIVRNGGHLSIHSGQTLSVGGDWCVTTNARFTSAADGIVRFTGSAPSLVMGDTTFGILESLASGKEISFAAGGNFAIASNGMLRIDGGTGSPITLRSQTDSAYWNLNLDATASAMVNNADVSDSDASAGTTIIAANTTLDNCVNWSSVSVTPGDLITWTGAASNSCFATPGNWTPERTPVTTDRILIQGTAPFMPKLSFDLICAELTIAQGASLNLNGHISTVNGPLTVAGKLTAISGETVTAKGDCSFAGGVLDTVGTSTLVLAGGTGSVAQLFTPGGLDFDTVRCSPGTSGISIAGSFSAAELSCSSASDTRLAFAAGAIITVTGNLLLDGTAATPCITLASSSPGTQWNIAAKGRSKISGVIVRDSTATDSTLYALDSTDDGNNSGWIFNTDPRITWVGQDSGDFALPSNWSANAVPSSGDSVFIADASVTVSSPVSVRAMEFGGNAVFTANAPVTVAKAVVIEDNASVAFNRKTIIGGSLILGGNATLTHSANTSTQANVLDVEVGGDLVIGSAATIDTRARGYVGSGPGCAANCGGSHGGRGETYLADANANRCYGSVYCPTNIGSAGATSSHSGGGAAKLAVAGVARLNGTINADGCSSATYPYYSGSGGSIWLTAARLLGEGEISANGGDCQTDYVGGGGRVALYLTAPSAKFDAFGGLISAYSGKYMNDATQRRRGSCGTVYLETANDDIGHGHVILDNSAGGIARVAPGQPRTDYPIARHADPLDGLHATWTLRNTVRLSLIADAKVADLVMEGSMPILELNGYTLRISAAKHPLGTDETLQILQGDGGRIIWGNPGTLLILR